MGQPFPFSMAFQPIVDVDAGRVFAYEALIRGVGGESAYSVLSQVTAENKYAFDQNCRVTAISLAARLGLAETGARLSINFMPGAVYSPAACIQLTLKTAMEFKFPTDQLIFEITEGEEVTDRKHLCSIVEEYRRRGFQVAIDDFGAGYAGMNLLADFPCDVLKLDMDLTRNVHQRPIAMSIVRSMVGLAKELGSLLVAEGIETEEEYWALRECGVGLMQGVPAGKADVRRFAGDPLAFAEWMGQGEERGCPSKSSGTSGAGIDSIGDNDQAFSIESGHGRKDAGKAWYRGGRGNLPNCPDLTKSEDEIRSVGKMNVESIYLQQGRGRYFDCVVDGGYVVHCTMMLLFHAGCR